LEEYYYYLYIYITK